MLPESTVEAVRVRSALKAERAAAQQPSNLPPLPRPTIYQSWYAATVGCTLVLCSTLYVASQYTDAHYTATKATGSSHRWFFPDIAAWTSVLFVCYFALLVVTRMRNRGLAGLYDAFWACNFCLVLCAFAIWLHLPSLLAATITLLSFEHLTFALDVAAFVVTGKFPLGAAGYLAWPTAVWMDFVTTSHHAWMIPLLCTVLYRSGGIPFVAWPLSIWISFSLSVVTRITIPKEMDGWTLSPVAPAAAKPKKLLKKKSPAAADATTRSSGDGDTEGDRLLTDGTATAASATADTDGDAAADGAADTTTDGTTEPLPFKPRPMRHYLNINMAHEMTRDVPVPALHVADTQPAPIYLLFLAVLGNVVFNGPTFLALRTFSAMVLERH